MGIGMVYPIHDSCWEESVFELAVCGLMHLHSNGRCEVEKVRSAHLSTACVMCFVWLVTVQCTETHCGAGHTQRKDRVNKRVVKGRVASKSLCT